VSAPAVIRTPLAELRRQDLVDRCAAFRVDDNRIGEPAVAVRAALRAVAGASSHCKRRSARPTAAWHH
jgi:hypothetical protein